VEWRIKDDQSKPDLARTLYEQIVTVDKVDLLMGPYATANSSNTAGTWKEGDSKAWESQLNTRAQNGQNEYSRASAP
jgi:hypothetical protein